MLCGTYDLTQALASDEGDGPSRYTSAYIKN